MALQTRMELVSPGLLCFPTLQLCESSPFLAKLAFVSGVICGRSVKTTSAPAFASAMPMIPAQKPMTFAVPLAD